MLAGGIDLIERFGEHKRIMVNLNESEAQAFQQIVNGERLWSWPNGRLQLGQSFPDVTLINRLVQEGLLDQHYEPTDAGRLALQSWLQARVIPRSAPPTSDEATRPSLTGD
jgi:hypothetical protein